ncbi:MAG: ABC transporter substrate-binding protein [Cyanobacteria bacterium P01_F01_bin.53]
MKRRRLFNQFALGATSAGLLSACNNSRKVFTPFDHRVDKSAPRVEWQMATSWPENLDIVFGTAQLICDRVSKLTQGNFTISAFPAGGLAPPLEILNTVQTSVAECGHTAGYYYTSRNKAFAFATSMPFGLNPHQHLAWLYGAGGMDLVRSLYADFGVINFPAGSTGNQMGGWFRNKIASVSELQGLKMRMPGLGGEVLKRIGAEVQNMPPNEILLSLERGNLDAAEWVGPYEDEKLGLNQHAAYYYYPGWHEPGTTYELIVNQEAYERLPEEYRQVLQVVSFEAQVMMLSRYDSVNREALQRLTNGGTELTVYTEEILQEARAAADDLYAEYASQDSTFRRIYDNWNAFRQGIYRWNSINERSFANLLFTS